MLRQTAKGIIEALSVLSGSTASARKRNSRNTLVLAYHNIVPNGFDALGDKSLHLSQSSFGSQLDSLMKTHQVISLSEAFSQKEFNRDGSRSSSRASGQQHNDLDLNKPRCVITFDDAYRGALTAGLHELSKRNLPATMFVAPGYLENKCFWWDLVTPEGADGIDDNTRETFLMRDRGQSERIVNQSALSRCTTLPDYAKSVSSDELDRALEYPLLTVGSHSWSHPNLAALDEETLLAELSDSHAWLKHRYSKKYIPAISYPYGRANNEVYKMAKQVGYELGLLIDGGWVQSTEPNQNTVERNTPNSVEHNTPKPAERFDIPRLNIPAGVSKNGFIMRSSGLINH